MRSGCSVCGGGYDYDDDEDSYDSETEYTSDDETRDSELTEYTSKGRSSEESEYETDDGSSVGIDVGANDGSGDGTGVGGSVGIGVGAIVGSGDGAGVGENVSTDTDRTNEDDIERRRLVAPSSAEADPNRRWPSAMAKSTIAAVRVPSATDALNTLVTCCYAPNCARAVRGAIAS